MSLPSSLTKLRTCTMYLLSVTLLWSLVMVTAQGSAVHLIYQLPIGTWVENLAVRANGQILFNTLSAPHLSTIDPLASDPTPSVVHTFPNVTGLTGITETSPDVFVLASGDIDLSTQSAAPGTVVVWSVDLNYDPPEVHRLVNITNSPGLNGVTSVPGNPNLVLMADSYQGLIYRLDVITGHYDVAILNEVFKPPATKDVTGLGINGIRTQEPYLYFTNSERLMFGRLMISDLGEAIGEVEILATTPATAVFDDLALDSDNNAWIATHPNQLNEIFANGTQKLVAGGGNDTTSFVQPTSARFGRVNGENGMLYLSCGGNPSTGGQIVAFDTRLV